MVGESGQDHGVAHHVLWNETLPKVHVRVVRQCAVLHRILDELEARQVHAVERLVVGSARIVEADGTHAPLTERQQP